MIREDLRNIAIIAHVDHGKTTLIDELLKQCGTFRQNQAVADRVMDSGDLERERGITILAKNTAVHYKGIKMNIVDTPGHADFGGEVERVLKMVNGVLLLVDAYEGPMPQTRFVLQRALELGLKAIIVVNKVDRPDARCSEVVDEILELLLDLDASDEQLDSPVIFASAREGFASLSQYEHGPDMTPLLDTIISHIPAPSGDENAPLQMLVSSIDYNEYVGRIAIGRVENGTLHQGQDILLTNYHATRPDVRAKAVNLYTFDGLKRVPVESAQPGEIVALSGLDSVNIGDTICDPKMRVRFEGIPTFAPEHFSVISQVDTMKRKQFVKGVTQIAQEGAIQIFHEPNSGMEEVIVGAVGVLQFEVLEYRLKNEYNIDIRRRDLSYSYIRWITSEGTDPTALNLASDTKWVQDFRGHNLLIFNNEWSIRWAEQKNPGLTLAEFSTNQDDEA